MTLDNVPGVPEDLSDLAMWDRRSRLAVLYLKGETVHRTLGTALGVSHTTIRRDIEALHRLWQDRAFQTAVRLVAEQLAKLDAAEKFATEQMDAMIVGKNQVAAFHWWTAWVKCITERCKILGVGPAVKLNITPDMPPDDPSVGRDVTIAIDVDYGSWTLDQLRDEYSTTQDRIKAVQEANRIVGEGQQE